MQATPATWRLLLEAGWQGKENFKVLCGGEPLPRDLASELVSRAFEVWNLYGPTETTVWSSVHRVTEVNGSIPIGKPIANTKIYVLDDFHQLTPVGVPGELYIGGAGISSGYLNRPELTAERFIPDMFSEDPHAKLYRTGDLGRYLADGSLEYLARVDNQVKVRGYRIELGEIESVLVEHPSVKQGVVTAREDRPGDVRLVAYIVYSPGEEATVTELRKHLRYRLPDYMIPQHLVELDNIPLTPNGKVDRKALPSPFGATLESDTYVAPSTDLERKIASIWQEALGVDRIGVHDNFFDIGGHSLLSMQVLVRMQKELGLSISPVTILLNTLGQIAHECELECSGNHNENSDDFSQNNKASLTQKVFRKIGAFRGKTKL
jgi:hypothetical protein